MRSHIKVRTASGRAMHMFKRKSANDEEMVPKVIELKVCKSPVKIQGSCRVNDTVLGSINAEEKEQVAIHFEGNTVLCTLYADHMIAEDTVKLRTDDMKRLGATEGQTVLLGSRKDMKAHLKETETEKED